MSAVIEQLEQKKAKALQLMQRLATFVSEGSALGITPPKGLQEKLEQAQRNIKTDRLDVALVGGFSEGKTSIAAAWLERLDKNTMKISHTESSDEVSVYEFGDALRIVDTPGLFGFKEKKNASNTDAEKYKDITKRYISEAHIVLYVMNPDNPIKESHQEDLQWMFGKSQGLNLLPRTIFILSQFDKVADIEDEQEFLRMREIKRRDVLKRLHDELGNDMVEESIIPIVAVAADPFGEGMEYWLNHMGEWRELSHIGELQDETDRKIENCGGAQVLANDVHASVIREVIHGQLPVAQEAHMLVAKDVERQVLARNSLRENIHSLKSEIDKTRVRLKGRILRYFQTDLIQKVEHITPEDFGEFFREKIGDDACLVDQRINELFLEETGGVNEMLNSARIDIRNEVSHRDEMVKMVTQAAKEGGKWLQKFAASGAIDGAAVKGSRDAIAKFFDMKPTEVYKFKNPHAPKILGKKINDCTGKLGSALMLIDITYDVWNAWSEHQKREEFFKAMEKFKEELKGFQNEITKVFADENKNDFVSKFFPMYPALEETLNHLNAETKSMEERGERFRKWCQEGEIIDAEFRELDSARA